MLHHEKLILQLFSIMLMREIIPLAEFFRFFFSEPEYILIYIYPELMLQSSLCQHVKDRFACASRTRQQGCEKWRITDSNR